MIRRLLFLFIILFFSLSTVTSVSAKVIDYRTGQLCQQGVDVCADVNKQAYDCTKSCDLDISGNKMCYCELSPIKGAFGKIQPPGPLAGFLQNDSTGAGAISSFLSNAVTLIYSLAGIALIFIFLWAAFEWMTSGGDKEKVASARGKIFNGIIGIVLLAIAFAIIKIFGQFTGFTFFAGQNVSVEKDSTGGTMVTCPDGKTFFFRLPDTSIDRATICKGYGN